MTSLPVHEIFDSIQGEGPFMGRGARFIRLQFCNLTCAWCDTKGTWLDRSGPHQDVPVAGLISKVADVPLCVVTGGEPLLHDFSVLWGDGVPPGRTVQVETNGTLLPERAVSCTLADGTRLERPPLPDSFVRTAHWVVSPKFGSSRQSVDLETLKVWTRHDRASFKFVVGDGKDWDLVTGLVADLGLEPSRVWIMPEGHTVQSQVRPDLAEAVIAQGWNLSLRLHSLLWGNAKGR